MIQNGKINIKLLTNDAKIPTRGTDGAAGFDIYASEDAVLARGKTTFVSTGIAMEIPEGFGGFVFPRSGLASRAAVRLSNCVAVIDSDYRGELKIPLMVDCGAGYPIKKGDRIAQIVFMPYLKAKLNVVEELSETERGSGGFGSTGK